MPRTRTISGSREPALENATLSGARPESGVLVACAIVVYFGVAFAVGAIDRARLNVHGSSLAVGHPFAATGARIDP